MAPIAPPRAVAVEEASAAEAPAAGPLVKIARAATAQDLASEGLAEKPAGGAASPGARATIQVRLQGRVTTLTVTRDPTQAAASLPYGNDLGMLFLPVKGTNVLFSLFETRSKDFARYAQSPTRTDGITLTDDWRKFKYKEIDVGRGEGEAAEQSDHPVMKVTWQQSVAFCDWLTTSDQAARPSHRRYRLPTDAEWSAAIGLLEERGDTPMEKFRNSKFRPPVYPWGDQAQPKDRAGNYADLAWKRAGVTKYAVIEGYDDGFATTAPVGSFAPVNGLYDLSGNVWEWCQDEVQEGGKTCHIARGGCWATYKAESLESAAREAKDEMYAPSDYGFRCVLAPE